MTLQCCADCGKPLTGELLRTATISRYNPRDIECHACRYGWTQHRKTFGLVEKLSSGSFPAELNVFSNTSFQDLIQVVISASNAIKERNNFPKTYKSKLITILVPQEVFDAVTSEPLLLLPDFRDIVDEGLASLVEEAYALRAKFSPEILDYCVQKQTLNFKLLGKKLGPKLGVLKALAQTERIVDGKIGEFLLEPEEYESRLEVKPEYKHVAAAIYNSRIVVVLDLTKSQEQDDDYALNMLCRNIQQARKENNLSRREQVGVLLNSKYTRVVNQDLETNNVLRSRCQIYKVTFVDDVAEFDLVTASTS